MIKHVCYNYVLLEMFEGPLKQSVKDKKSSNELKRPSDMSMYGNYPATHARPVSQDLQ